VIIVANKADNGTAIGKKEMAICPKSSKTEPISTPLLTTILVNRKS